MKRYTEEEIERYSKNPNVKLVTETKMVLTYEFRMAIYKEWGKNPTTSTIRRMLNEGDIDTKEVGSQFIKHLSERFRKFGRPSNGKRSIAARTGTTGSDTNKLLETGKFVRRGKGITFAADFEEELESKYPEQTIEEGLVKAGINPETVGYQRIYQLERKFKGINPRNGGILKPCIEYTEDAIAVISQHPYVEKVTAKQLRFRRALYEEASTLIQNGYKVDDILKIYEIPEEWLGESRKLAMYYRSRQIQTKEHEYETDTTDWSPEKEAAYIKIQRNRAMALESIVTNEYETLKARFPTLNQLQKKCVCEWVRDDLLPKVQEFGGRDSIPSVLKQIGISRSVYYRLLKDDTVAEKMAARKAREEEEMKLVRQVAEYEGYPKGSRQIYMQMPVLTGKRMSRKKIIKLQKKMNLTCSVRKSNVNRQAARKRLITHVKSNLLQRKFKLHRPGKAILTDVTYLKYHHGKKLAYASAAIDAVTGRLYEMNVSEYNDVELVIQTLLSVPHPGNDADGQNKPILHTDQGSVYLTDEYQELLAELGFVHSMSKRGNCWDNAPQESFFGHFKDEVHYCDLETVENLRTELKRYKKYFNEIRGQWNRGKMTPLQRESWINGLSAAAYEEWQKQEKERYEQMKRISRQKAVERNRTLGV